MAEGGLQLLVGLLGLEVADLLLIVLDGLFLALSDIALGLAVCCG